MSAISLGGRSIRDGVPIMLLDETRELGEGERGPTIVTDAPTPSEIRLSSDRRTLQVGFETGENFALSAELLPGQIPVGGGAGAWRRPEGHAAGQAGCEDHRRRTGWQYAVRLVFDDGHNTGIFSWDILFDYGRRQDSLMAAYRERLGTA